MVDETNTNNIIELPYNIAVRDLASTLGVSPIEVIKTLMSFGVMANINQVIDYDTSAVVADELGIKVQLQTIDQAKEEDIGEVPLWRQFIAGEDDEKLTSRAPVVTILGHVDHGKTTLLDAIRQTSVAEGEAGGITQHIGAYQVEHQDNKITFLDTPGHAAFTQMRARGAQGADIVILVVAADDGVMPQTKEAAAHAKAAKVPIIVAMNKMDKDNADPEKVKQQLSEIGLIPDDWDGDTLIIPLSAKKKEGLDDLLDAITLVAETMDIHANPEGKLFGTVIEARRERGRGVVSTLLIQNGTLHVGNTVVAGVAYGKLRAIFDQSGNRIMEAGPSTPVAVMGFSDVPAAGDICEVVPDTKAARILIQERILAAEKEIKSVERAITLEQLFAQVQAGTVKELRLIVKADVQGSLQPIISSLEDLSTEDIGVNILHRATGNISEQDIMLAIASKAIVIGFNVTPDNAAQRLAMNESISIRTYDIIYRLIEDIEKALKGLLEPEIKEIILGSAKILAVFTVSKLGNVAGCKVTDGVLRRNGKMRVLRKGEIIFEGMAASLKHHKENVNEIRSGFECGIGLRGFNDFKPQDIIECFTEETVAIV